MTTATAERPAIYYITCDSSQIHSYGYHAPSQTLGVKFRAKSSEPDAEPTEYHYFGVPQDVADAFAASESKGAFHGKNIRGVYAYGKQPNAAGVVFGLSQHQENKYTTGRKDGRLVNRATGKPIPDDEPVFILRASDVHAIVALEAYRRVLPLGAHLDGVKRRIAMFGAFSIERRERMKEPD